MPLLRLEAERDGCSVWDTAWLSTPLFPAYDDPDYTNKHNAACVKYREMCEEHFPVGAPKNQGNLDWWKQRLAHRVRPDDVGRMFDHLGSTDEFPTIVALMSYGEHTWEQALAEVRWQLRNKHLLHRCEGLVLPLHLCPLWTSDWNHISIIKRPGVRISVRPAKLVREILGFEGPEADAMVRDARVEDGYVTCDLQFTTDARRIVEVYTEYTEGTGAQSPLEISCMRHEQGDFDCRGVHPVEFYGGCISGDVQLCYAEDSNTELTTARTLINTARKTHSRIYASSGEMHRAFREKLKSLGYDEDWTATLNGTRWKILRDRNGRLVGPYVDGDLMADIHHDHILLCSGGGIDIHEASGCWDESAGMTSCESCGCRIHEEDAYFLGDSPWCESCYNEYWLRCVHCGDAVYRDDATIIDGHGYCSDRCAQRDGFQMCRHCGEYANRGDLDDYGFCDNRSCNNESRRLQEEEATEAQRERQQEVAHCCA